MTLVYPCLVERWLEHCLAFASLACSGREVLAAFFADSERVWARAGKRTTLANVVRGAREFNSKARAAVSAAGAEGKGAKLAAILSWHEARPPSLCGRTGLARKLDCFMAEHVATKRSMAAVGKANQSLLPSTADADAVMDVDEGGGP